MYAQYQTVDYNTRVSLGNGITSNYWSSVLADWVGILTGTITNTTQLSAYADKPSCSLQGAVGDWVVYDNDAHPSFAGKCKVLRRKCVDTINYQYLFIGFHVSSPDVIYAAFLPFGGWNLATKAPTTTMPNGSNNFVVANTVVNATQIAMEGSNFSFGPSGTQTRAPGSWKILSTPGMLAIWPDASATMDYGIVTLLAEFQTMHPWNSSALGVTPLIYNSAQGVSLSVRAPHMRNSLGNVVTPDYTRLNSTAYFSPAAGHSGFSDVSVNLSEYTRDATGAKAIPVLPIDVTTKLGTNGYFCYAGRVLELFATLPFLNVSDTFTIGAHTYVVIPVGGYSTSLPGYSSNGKLCAKVQ